MAEAIEAEIADLLPPLIALHHNLGEIYRKKVRDLKAYLAAADDKDVKIRKPVRFWLT